MIFLANKLHILILILKNTIEHCSKTVSNIFALILSLCKKLIDLNFCDMFFTRKYSISVSDLSATSYISSTLTKLKINVATFNDCLYLLDGRFDCLSTLIINVLNIYYPISDIDKTVSIISMIILEKINMKLNK